MMKRALDDQYVYWSAMHRRPQEVPIVRFSNNVRGVLANVILRT